MALQALKSNTMSDAHNYLQSCAGRSTKVRETGVRSTKADDLLYRHTNRSKGTREAGRRSTGRLLKPRSVEALGDQFGIL